MPQSLQLSIDGMHCGGCVARVTSTLKKLDGVEVLEVQVGSARVEFDAARTAPEAIAAAIEKIGFPTKPA